MHASWHSYPSIFSLGHRAVRDLLTVPHCVEEKIDGSQFSFGKFQAQKQDGEFWEDIPGEFELRIRSKGCVMHIDAPEKMFTKAAETVRAIADVLHPGWTYRAEFLAKPQHNTLKYARVPANYLIIFDVSTGDNEWLKPREKAVEAERIGLECVPVVFSAKRPEDTTYDALRQLLDQCPSVLGDQLIEGVVIKPLVELYGPDKKTLMGKFVSERFKEAHSRQWKITSPNSGDVIEQIVKQYKVEGRWLKAVQHLRERGELMDTPADIGKLMAEVKHDTGQEEQSEITQRLWAWAWPKIARGIAASLPEWYKDQLLKRQFELGDNDTAGMCPPDAHLGATESHGK